MPSLCTSETDERWEETSLCNIREIVCIQLYTMCVFKSGAHKTHTHVQCLMLV